LEHAEKLTPQGTLTMQLYSGVQKKPQAYAKEKRNEMQRIDIRQSVRMLMEVM
jgi:hypothetical protein